MSDTCIIMYVFVRDGNSSCGSVQNLQKVTDERVSACTSSRTPHVYMDGTFFWDIDVVFKDVLYLRVAL